MYDTILDCCVNVVDHTRAKLDLTQQMLRLPHFLNEQQLREATDLITVMAHEEKVLHPFPLGVLSRPLIFYL